MKAFVMSLVVLAVVTAGAAFVLETFEQSASETFKSGDSVRL